jgi:acetoin utilization protein AcuB
MKLVRDLMHRPVLSISPNDNLRHAVRIMNEHHVRQLPVADGSKLVGILTDRDIRLHVVHLEDRTESADSFNEALEAPVDGVMTRDVKSLHADHTVDDALNLFISEKFGAAPIVEGDDCLIGILTYIDLLVEYRRTLTASR